MDTKSKIIVCYHKDFPIFKNEVLLPLHVGKEISSNMIKDIETDNTGNNISIKNDSYCELTGLYWLWKNVEAENYGLFHYRRFLDLKNKYNTKNFIYPSILNINDWSSRLVDSLMDTYDIILPKKTIFDLNIHDYYKKKHIINDLDIVVDIIKRDYPQYSSACDKALSNNECYFCNMFIMKKDIFNEYCTWLFDILNKAEEKIIYKGRNSYQRRVFGFLSERMLNIFIQYKIDTNPNIRIKEVKTIFIDDEPVKKIFFGIGEYLRFPSKIFFRFANIKFTHHIKEHK